MKNRSGASSQSYINLDNARRDDQRNVMEGIKTAQECPFCPENLGKYHKQPVLRRGTHWILTRNQWPYEHAKHHLLAIATTHQEHLTELPPEAMADLLELFKWAVQEYDLPSGALAMRFGDVTNTGATVLHLHAHLIMADPEKPEDVRVRFRVG